MKTQKIIQMACGFLGLAVVIGAFGAHGLEKQLSEASKATFETGVSYQFYHGFGIMIAALLQGVFPKRDLKKTVLSFSLGIFFFSFNCYLYAITGIKTFALLVPIGGLAFIMGWAFMYIEFKRKVD